MRILGFMCILGLHFVCLISFVVSAKGQDYFYKTTPERAKVIHLVASIREINADQRYFDKNHLKMVIYIDKIPTEKDNNYRVIVGQDQGWRVENRYYFVVNARTFSIKYWAVIEDKEISLSLWRKHHYKDW